MHGMTTMRQEEFSGSSSRFVLENHCSPILDPGANLWQRSSMCLIEGKQAKSNRRISSSSRISAWPRAVYSKDRRAPDITKRATSCSSHSYAHRVKSMSYHQPPVMNMSFATSLISRLDKPSQWCARGDMIDIAVQVAL